MMSRSASEGIRRPSCDPLRDCSPRHICVSEFFGDLGGVFLARAYACVRGLLTLDFLIYKKFFRVREALGIRVSEIHTISNNHAVCSLGGGISPVSELCPNVSESEIKTAGGN